MSSLSATAAAAVNPSYVHTQTHLPQRSRYADLTSYTSPRSKTTIRVGSYERAILSNLDTKVEPVKNLPNRIGRLHSPTKYKKQTHTETFYELQLLRWVELGGNPEILTPAARKLAQELPSLLGSDPNTPIAPVENPSQAASVADKVAESADSLFSNGNRTPPTGPSPRPSQLNLSDASVSDLSDSSQGSVNDKDVENEIDNILSAGKSPTASSSSSSGNLAAAGSVSPSGVAPVPEPLPLPAAPAATPVSRSPSPPRSSATANDPEPAPLSRTSSTSSVIIEPEQPVTEPAPVQTNPPVADTKKPEAPVKVNRPAWIAATVISSLTFLASLAVNLVLILELELAWVAGALAVLGGPIFVMAVAAFISLGSLATLIVSAMKLKKPVSIA